MPLLLTTLIGTPVFALTDSMTKMNGLRQPEQVELAKQMIPRCKLSLLQVMNKARRGMRGPAHDSKH